MGTKIYTGTEPLIGKELKPFIQKKISRTKGEAEPIWSPDTSEGVIELGIIRIEWKIDLKNKKAYLKVILFGIFIIFDAELNMENLKLNGGIDVQIAKATISFTVDWDKGIQYSLFAGLKNFKDGVFDGTWTSRQDEGWLLIWGAAEFHALP